MEFKPCAFAVLWPFENRIKDICFVVDLYATLELSMKKEVGFWNSAMIHLDQCLHDTSHLQLHLLEQHLQFPLSLPWRENMATAPMFDSRFTFLESQE